MKGYKKIGSIVMLTYMLSIMADPQPWEIPTDGGPNKQPQQPEITISESVASPIPASIGSAVVVPVYPGYVPNKNVTQCIQYIFDLTGKAQAPTQKMLLDKKAFISQMGTVLDTLLKAAEAATFTAFLKERDLARTSALNNPSDSYGPQGLAASLTNAYMTYQSDVDLVIRLCQQLLTGTTSLFNYDLLVSSLGQGSEITLRNALTPLATLIAQWCNNSKKSTSLQTQLTLSPVASSGASFVIKPPSPYEANKNVMHVIQYLLDVSGTQQKPTDQMNIDFQIFLSTVGKSLRNLINAVHTPGFTAFLQARDMARNAQIHGPENYDIQTTTSAFNYAYTNHQPDVDTALQYWHQVVCAFNSVFNYDLMVASVGNGSELKLRDTLVSLTKSALHYTDTNHQATLTLVLDYVQRIMSTLDKIFNDNTAKTSIKNENIFNLKDILVSLKKIAEKFTTT